MPITPSGAIFNTIYVGKKHKTTNSKNSFYIWARLINTGRVSLYAPIERMLPYQI